MINKLTKELVDLIYNTERVRRKYQMNNPSETVLAADGSKGVMTVENQEIKRGLNWTTSQRAVIMLTDKKLVCGKWIIPLNQISSGQLVKVKALFGSGQILKIQTKDNEYYQFGMQLNTEWTNQHVLPLTVETGQIKHSAISILVRIIAVGYLIYLLYDSFIK
jgi:hypothetical protein